MGVDGSASPEKKGHIMTVTVCMNEAGAVWIENVQGDILAACFFKTEEETEDELLHMGYQRLLTAYPTAHIVAGTGIDPADLGEVFLEVCGRRDHGPTAAPQRGDTPCARE
jgi:hypothetical protein